MKIICFANQKGGVGKTTSAVNIADGLARRHQRVLLIDLDPQGHAALSLGFPKTPSLYRLLSLDEPFEKVVTHARPGLDLIAGDKTTEKVKRQIALQDFRETVLADQITKVAYDVILLDLAPSLDVLHLNGLYASDWVIIPTRLDLLSLDGVTEILATMADLAAAGKRYHGYSILPTFFERTTRETFRQFRDLVSIYRQHVWPPIPQDSLVREASSVGKTLWELNRRSSALDGFRDGRQRLGGYRQVLDRLLEVVNGKDEIESTHPS